MNNSLPKNPKLNTGQTLLSLLIAMAVFALLGNAIFTLVSSSFQLIGFSRARIAARHLALEKMESVRNLPYGTIGTVGGIPSGPIEQNEKIVRNGLSYEVKTSIVYIDDPFDEQAPDDLLPTDYKRARVEVSWEGLAASRRNPIVLVTDISPRGIETSVGGGTLSILVFDANAIPIAQAAVHIVATEVDPAVDLDLETNENGRIILPGTPICISCYQITVTKDSHSTDRTYSTDEVANPNKSHQSIIEGLVTEVSFAIDKVSTLDLSSVSDRDSGFSPLESISFRFRGQKTIGTDVDDLPVYKYDEQLATNSSGNLTLEDMEWDNYEIIVSSATGWDISGTNPLTPFSVLPDTENNIDFALTSHTNHSLLAIFTDSGSIPIASVSATLSRKPSYEEEKLTGSETDPDFGQAFFSNLTDQKYDMTATASGYQDHDGKINISGYKKEITILNPN